MEFAAAAQGPIMNWDSDNLNEAWKKFEQLCNLYYSGPLKQKTDGEKASYFYHGSAILAVKFLILGLI